MAYLSKYLRSATDSHGLPAVIFKCPGCKSSHMLPIGAGPGHRWTYNNEPESPTFTPSVFCKTIRPKMSDAEWDEYDKAFTEHGSDYVVNDPRFRHWCHSFIRDGMIQYLNDSTHELAGQQVELGHFVGPVGDAL